LHESGSGGDIVTSWNVEVLNAREQIDDVLAIEQVSFNNPWTREMYLAEFDNPAVSRCYLARNAAGAVVGFCSIWRVLDELHINNLAVTPAHRRAGVASALLRRVLGDGAASGAVTARLEVRRSNEPAQRLYERFGFRVAGVRRNYYTLPVEDAIVLINDGLMHFRS
jgi:ribosomal-protein-alanine N-acetyltransferase